MKKLIYKQGIKVTLLVVFSVFVTSIISCNANTKLQEPDTVDIAPDWYPLLPQKQGFIYGVGKATSLDLANATQKASHFASTNLAENYPNHFSTFEKKCDSLLDSETQQEVLTTLIKKTTQAQLTDIETIDQKVINVNGTYIVYMLKRVAINSQVTTLKKSIAENAELKKAFRQKELKAALDNL